MNWLEYRRSKGLDISPFDEDNGGIDAELMPGYEPPAMSWVGRMIFSSCRSESKSAPFLKVRTFCCRPGNPGEP